jgi:hypothetical protein
MADQGYNRCNSNHCFYFKRLYDDIYIILCLYVDDMILAESKMDHIKELKKQLPHSFSMKEFGDRKTNPWYEDYQR